MPYNGYSVPVSLTPITVAFYVTNVKENGENHEGRIVTIEALFPLAAGSYGTGSIPTAALANAAVTDAKMATQKVTRAGDTMTGHLQFANNFGVAGTDTLSNLRMMVQIASDNIGRLGNSGLHTILQSANTIEVSDGTTGSLIHTGNDGPGSGFDADLLDGAQGSAYLARANHTGTQAPATISPQGAGSGFDADTVDGLSSATLLARANHTGTQTPSTILPAVLPLNNNAADVTILINGGASMTLGSTAGPGGIAGIGVVGGIAATGIKSANVPDRNGVYHIFHSLESPAAYFEDFGRARLDGGVAWVRIPKDFAQYVRMGEPYFVHLTAQGPAALYVDRQTPTHFIVRAATDSCDQQVRFVWRVTAQRADVPGERLMLGPQPPIQDEGAT